MKVPWDGLHTFLIVARFGSLSAAARVLKVSQPTVGRRLQALEQSLNTRLIDRLPAGIMLTNAGLEVLTLVESMGQAAEQIGVKAVGLAETLRGTVRLSVEEVTAVLIAGALRELRKSCPDIEIEISVDHRFANLSRREADVAIRYQAPSEMDLVARKVGAMGFAVYGEQSFVEANPCAWTKQRFEHCPWVGFDEDYARLPEAKWLLENISDGVPVVRSNNRLLNLSMVKHGLGLGVLPCFLADGDQDLVRLTPVLPEVTPSLWLVVHEGLKKVPRVRAVMDHLADFFRAHRGSLIGQPSGTSPRDVRPLGAGCATLGNLLPAPGRCLAGQTSH